MKSNELLDVSPDITAGTYQTGAAPRHRHCWAQGEIASGLSGDDLAFIINHFLAELDQIYDKDDIWRLVMTLGADLGFDNLAYQHLIAPGTPKQESGALALSWGSGDEVKALLKSLEKASQDARMAMLADLHKPEALMIWIDRLNRQGGKVNLLRAFAMRNFERGYIFPVFANHGRNGYVIINVQTVLSAPRESLLLWICQTAHLKYLELLPEAQNPDVKLSMRERQVLYWVARGKSNSVIASIIGISPHTVNGYLRKIYLKTNTSDRTTAAIFAMRVGAII